MYVFDPVTSGMYGEINGKTIKECCKGVTVTRKDKNEPTYIKVLTLEGKTIKADDTRGRLLGDIVTELCNKIARPKGAKNAKTKEIVKTC